MKNKIFRKNRGFTLIEILVALAITGLITSGLAATAVQIYRVNAMGNNNTMAFRQVQYAGQYISKDMLQAGETSDTPNVTTIQVTPEIETIIVWWDYTTVYPDGGKHKVRYIAQSDTTTLRTDDFILIRQDINNYADLNNWPAVAPENSMTVAHSITAIDFDLGTNELTVTATVGNGSTVATETRIYKIDFRIGT